MANENEATTETLDELDDSLWLAVAAFVKKCGGDVAKVSDAEREEFGEALAAWAVLALVDEAVE